MKETFPTEIEQKKATTERFGVKRLRRKTRARGCDCHEKRNKMNLEDAAISPKLQVIEMASQTGNPSEKKRTVTDTANVAEYYCDKQVHVYIKLSKVSAPALVFLHRSWGTSGPQPI